MFRLHFDIQLFEDEQKSAELAKEILKRLRETANTFENNEMGGTSFRMTKDGDRGSRNYMNVTPEGHVSTNKLKLFS